MDKLPTPPERHALVEIEAHIIFEANAVPDWEVFNQTGCDGTWPT